MAYDEGLAAALRDELAGTPDLTEKAMFGGLAFLVAGHMAVSASGQDGLLVRCDPAATDVLVAEPGVERFEMRGRPMNGWLHVQVDPADHEAVARWAGVGTAYVATLPPK
ncbi:TfoX/Sxy family protein [Nocardioides sp. KIGAM211]|uniref:TfoX/Sxy family protein n=1 Tax=Nocardioides luti TaxID=2761101 RepID=A0A7X0RHX4_9ACTN|nr:TfoX/Sxy family protein [Nocardioides luti]MBB6628435.1 TfoX/Sxy family protein [Nocardioides luti]